VEDRASEKGTGKSPRNHNLEHTASTNKTPRRRQEAPLLHSLRITASQHNLTKSRLDKPRDHSFKNHGFQSTGAELSRPLHDLREGFLPHPRRRRGLAGSSVLRDLGFVAPHPPSCARRRRSEDCTSCGAAAKGRARLPKRAGFALIDRRFTFHRDRCFDSVMCGSPCCFDGPS
jgi:hypothetical protein